MSKGIFIRRSITGLFTVVWCATCLGCGDETPPVDDTPVPSILPVAESSLDLVNLGQPYRPPDHIGIDLGCNTSNLAIVAPISGQVTEVLEKINETNGHRMTSVDIRSGQWHSFVVFEPDTADDTVNETQRSNIVVAVGDQVEQGESLGTLIVSPPANTADWYPHVHWSHYRGDLHSGNVCPREA
ncbi:MAG: hypothetical protein KJ956_14885, partial [Actinobacteria bacterium]|nr:hypothetical protein [Actinomycetota bacterium]